MAKQTNAAIVEPDNSPGVIAYRVGQLEEAVKLGFRQHNDKLDALINNFATKEELLQLSVKITSLEPKVEILENTNARQQGAINLLKGVSAFLVGIAAVIGALWWIGSIK